MTVEEIDLLYKDLCARIPYGVAYHWKGRTGEDDMPHYLNGMNEWMIFYIQQGFVKPYLRSMESMTEEELREFAKLKFKDDGVWEIVEFPEMKFGFRGFINVLCRNKNNGDTWIYQVNTRTPLETYYGIDWLNKNHFDYRGLIEKRLAIKVTPENNPYKES